MFCKNCGHQIVEGNRFCSNCGTDSVSVPGTVQVGTPPPAQQQVMDTVNAPAQTTPKAATSGQASMQVAKLVIGILSIALSFLITFQSCAAGVVNVLESNNESSGSIGVLLAFCWLVGGVVGISTRKPKNGSRTAGGFYLFAGVVAIGNAGVFADLQIWSWVSFIFAVVFLMSAVFERHEKIAAESIHRHKKSLIITASILAITLVLFFAQLAKGSPLADEAKGEKPSASSTTPTSKDSVSAASSSVSSSSSSSLAETADTYVTKGSLGNFDILFLYAELDQSGVLSAWLDFTNNGSEAKSFAWDISVNAYQNGVELEDVYLSSQQDFSERSIKDGGTVLVLIGKQTLNTSDPITLEFSESWAMNNEKLTMLVRPDELISAADATEDQEKLVYVCYEAGTNPGLEPKITFFKDGTLLFDVTFPEGTTTREGSWQTITENNLLLSFDNASIHASLVDTQLVIEYGIPQGTFGFSQDGDMFLLQTS